MHPELVRNAPRSNSSRSVFGPNRSERRSSEEVHADREGSANPGTHTRSNGGGLTKTATANVKYGHATGGGGDGGVQSNPTHRRSRSANDQNLKEMTNSHFSNPSKSKIIYVTNSMSSSSSRARNNTTNTTNTNRNTNTNESASEVFVPSRSGSQAIARPDIPSRPRDLPRVINALAEAARRPYSTSSSSALDKMSGNGHSHSQGYGEKPVPSTTTSTSISTGQREESHQRRASTPISPSVMSSQSVQQSSAASLSRGGGGRLAMVRPLPPPPLSPRKSALASPRGGPLKPLHPSQSPLTGNSPTPSSAQAVSEEGEDEEESTDASTSSSTSTPTSTSTSEDELLPPPPPWQPMVEGEEQEVQEALSLSSLHGEGEKEKDEGNSTTDNAGWMAYAGIESRYRDLDHDEIKADKEGDEGREGGQEAVGSDFEEEDAWLPPPPQIPGLEQIPLPTLPTTPSINQAEHHHDDNDRDRDRDNDCDHDPLETVVIHADSYFAQQLREGSELTEKDPRESEREKEKDKDKIPLAWNVPPLSAKEGAPPRRIEHVRSQSTASAGMKGTAQQNQGGYRDVATKAMERSGGMRSGSDHRVTSPRISISSEELKRVADIHSPAMSVASSSKGATGPRETSLTGLASQPSSTSQASRDLTPRQFTHERYNSTSTLDESTMQVTARGHIRTDSIFRLHDTGYSVTSWKRGDLIGKGAFGHVYVCLDLVTGKPIANKEIHFIGNNIEAQMASVQKEIDIMQRLRHTNLVCYLGVEKAGHSLNIFQEYAAVGSLTSLLEKYGVLPERVVQIYCKQMTRGLRYLHSHRIVHRDIKAANCLMGGDGTVKLADFGCSKSLETVASLREGMPTLCGTPHYMAPEVIRQKGVGRRSDIWSLGCTVIELLTGHPPWHEIQNYTACLFTIASGKAPPAFPPGISREGEDFLNKCFIRNPRQRPTAKSLLKHPWLAMVEDGQDSEGDEQ